MSHTWLEMFSRKVDPPAKGPEQEPLAGKSRQQGRLWAMGFSEMLSLSPGAESLYYPPKEKPSRVSIGNPRRQRM